MNIIGKLRKSLTERRAMRFKIANPDDSDDGYDGVIMDIKRSHVILREIRDFEVKGIIILARKSITGYRDGKYEDCLNAILCQNHQVDRLKIPEWLTKQDSIPNVLKVLKKKNIWPSINIIFDP